MPSKAQLEGPTQEHERLGAWQGGRLRSAPSTPVALEPVRLKEQIAIRLKDPFNGMARELAGRRGQPVGRVLADILALVLPEALAAERSRDIPLPLSASEAP